MTPLITCRKHENFCYCNAHFDVWQLNKWIHSSGLGLLTFSVIIFKVVTLWLYTHILTSLLCQKTFKKIFSFRNIKSSLCGKIRQVWWCMILSKNCFAESDVGEGIFVMQIHLSNQIVGLFPQTFKKCRKVDCLVDCFGGTNP